ncbi:hypothetical protein JCM14076_20750 [Methylosoma difficile]
MKKTTFVALLLLSAQCVAENLTDSIADIEQRWATIYYNTAKAQQSSAYQALLEYVAGLSKGNPSQADVIYWQAVIKSSYAEHLDPVSALDAIYESRDLLEKSIKLNPKVMNGSGYVTLGTLYYKVPAWPVAFGNDEKAEELLKAGLKVNPEGVDANYFYGDFLLSENRIKEAEAYLKHALSISQPNLTYTDKKLKEEAKLALQKAQHQEADAIGDDLSLSEPISRK